MNKKSRKILFWMCLILFLIASPAILFYCLGYRLDFPGKGIVKTGALYLRVTPKQAYVFLDDKSKEKTDFFFGTALIENLLPENYQVKIEKQGYQSWEKTLAIEESQATEAKNIALVPEKLDLEVLNENTVDFWFSPDSQKIILKEKNLDQQGIEKGWKLKLFNIENKIKTSAFEEQNALSNLQWSSDSKKILLEIESGNEKKYSLLDLSVTPIKAETLEFLKDEELIPFFHPDDDQKLILKQKNEQGLATLWESDFKGESLRKIIDNVASFVAFNKNIVWLDENGFLQKSNTQGQTQAMSLSPLDEGEVNNCELVVLNANIFALKNKKLWFFDNANKTFKNIGDNVDGLAISPNGKKLCFWNDFQVEIFFFEEEISQPIREKGSKILLTRLSQKIQDFFWWNDHYLVFQTQETIKIIEIDDRDSAQTWDLVRLKNPKAHFNLKDRKLYLLSQGDFLSSSPF